MVLKTTTAVKAMVFLTTVAVTLFTCAPGTTTKTSGGAVKYVAVVETDIDPSSGASATLTSADARLVTAELRREAVNNLPMDKYNIMTSETVQSMGGAVLEECAEENCVIVLGSKIGADYIVRGTISKIQTMFILTVEMYETDNGTLIASSNPVRSENVGELLEKAAAACGEMYRKFVDPKSAKAQTGSKLEPAVPLPTSTPTPKPIKTYTVIANTNPTDGGFVSLNPNKTAYNAGELVTITATATDGYVFMGWSGNVRGMVNPGMITVNKNLTMTAKFQQPPKPTSKEEWASPQGYQVPEVDASVMLTDGRDGKRYRTVVIGGKMWMAENLNYKMGKSWCYGNDNSYSDKYGRLYNWKTAKKICPSGWHLPSNLEWESVVADKDKFSAQFGGQWGYTSGYSGYSFIEVGKVGYWWTATEHSGDKAYIQTTSANYWNKEDKDYGFSVRCVVD